MTVPSLEPDALVACARALCTAVLCNLSPHHRVLKLTLFAAQITHVRSGYNPWDGGDGRSIRKGCSGGCTLWMWSVCVHPLQWERRAAPSCLLPIAISCTTAVLCEPPSVTLPVVRTIRSAMCHCQAAALRQHPPTCKAHGQPNPCCVSATWDEVNEQFLSTAMIISRNRRANS